MIPSCPVLASSILEAAPRNLGGCRGAWRLLQEIVMLLSLVFPSALMASAHGVTIIVHPTAHPLQDALYAAVDGDIFRLDPRTHATVALRDPR